MIATVVQHLPCFKDLIAVLFECFLIITLGYLSCRFKLISTQAKDLNSYLTTFALPMIIFLNIAQMNFQTINVSFLLCMLTSKLLVFILVTLLTLAISYPTNFGYAGALSILATQSNDFALGYPLIKSLYGETRSEMLDYLNLMAPIQLLILNPLGIVMLEYQKSRRVRILNKQKGLCKTTTTTTFNDGNSKRTGLGSHVDDENSDEIDDNDDEEDEEVKQKCHDKLSLKCKCFTSDLNTSGQHDPNCRQCISNVNSISDGLDSIGDGNRLRQQIRRRLSANEKADECLQTINERVTKKHSTTSSILKVGNKNIKSLKLIIPSMDNIVDRRDSDSSLRPIAKSPTDRFNSIATTACCCYGLPNDSGASCRVSSMQQTDNIIPHTSTNDAVSFDDNNNNIASKFADSSADNVNSAALNLNFLKALATNPLIIASVVALAVNLIHGPQLPKLVTKVSNTIAASFAAPALFVVGLSMYGKFELILKNPHDLLLSSVLVLTKVILLPNLMRTLALIILPPHTPTEEIPYLIDFSFLYGLLPTAPTACIIAKQYGVLTNVVSISMLLSIFLSAPLMLAASVIINPASVVKLSDIQSLLSQTLKISSLITLILASIALYGLWNSTKSYNYNRFINLPLVVACRQVTSKIKTNPTNIFLFLLAITQIIIGLGGLCWYFVDTIQIDPNLQTMPSKSLQHIDLDFQIKNNNNNTSKIIEKLTPTNLNTLNTSSDNILIEFEPIPIDLPSPIPIDSKSKPTYGEDDSSLDQTTSLIQQNANNSPIWLPSMSSSEVIHNYSSPINSNSVSLERWSALQYILSSYGILSARFVILCILFTTASIRFGGCIMATKVSSIMVKSFLFTSMVLIIWLLFDTQQRDHSHFPAESLVPGKKCSLYIRLVYDTLFIILSVPLFAFIIRSDNKTKRTLQEKISSGSSSSSSSTTTTTSPSSSNNHEELIDESIVVTERDNGVNKLRSRKRSNLATSNVSLSSDTSTASTANTNLESTPSSNISINDVNNSNFRQQNQNVPLPDSVSVLIESYSSTNNNNNNHSTVSKRVLNSILDNQSNDVNSIDNNNSIEVECNEFNGTTYNISSLRRQQESLQDRNDEISLENDKTKLAARLIQMSEFNKYSILILFMLITTTLNLTSIIQKLIQDKAFGTFRQIEIMGVALEFGQGLLTFLIYGIRGALK